RSLRREAVDRMTSWASVGLAIGILHCVGAASLPPPPQPHLGHAAGGAESRGRVARPEWSRVPLSSPANASPFWIMLLLSLGVPEHRMIDAGRTRGRAPDHDLGVRSSNLFGRARSCRRFNTLHGALKRVLPAFLSYVRIVSVNPGASGASLRLAYRAGHADC